ncbi:O-antigen ligase family protein [Erwiniaceae bacterium BAC15a-03b]|uniref:O-antigen ligase family protein n=1 Tax=Winslowiella arboricola TaxID=2978220 RepID=A0A9J6PR35_9GAMM|nr:O-antigen ligase family protein [Winslowiella arboricola]MCU5774272.1 O-antigen ligase family protein [Winslowiella arboricola]MCU5778819.1 O-antigen ligase family protein [Winslowiella arboricola]
MIVLLPMALIGLFYRKDFLRFEKIELYLLLLFAYVIISTVMYNKSALGDFDFYRRDGNFIISYLILFVFIFLPLAVNINVDRAFYIIFAIFFGLSCVGFVGMPLEEGVYRFFFVSHNAAGGFYSVVASACLGLWWVKRRPLYLLYSLAFVFFLYQTDSRGSVLAIIAAIGYGLTLRFKRPGLVFGLFLAVQLLVVLDTYPVWLSMGKIMSVGANFTINQDMDFERAGTFIDRLYYLWPRAFDNFLHSPILGMGFGSFDDLWYRYTTVIPHILTLKDHQLIRHTDSHAHNSTFTILAELGLVGYTLFVLLFGQMLLKIRKMKDFDPGLSLALTLSFWTCVFSSATEHRITTPAQMIPFFTLFGIGYVKYFGKKREAETLSHHGPKIKPPASSEGKPVT